MFSAINKLSIRSKLFTAFALVYLILLGLGGFAVNRIGRVDEPAAELRDHWIPRIELLGQFSRATERVRLDETLLLIPSTDEEHAAVGLARIEQIQKADDLLKSYHDAVKGIKEENYADATSEAWNAYLDEDRKVLKLEQDGNIKDAAAAISGAFKTMQTLRSAIDEEIGFDRTEARISANTGSTLAARSRVAIMLVMVMTTVPCLLIVTWLDRNTSKRIVRLVGVLRGLLHGEYDYQIPCVVRNDEIGELARGIVDVHKSLIETERLAAEQHAAQEARQVRASRVDALTLDFEMRTGDLVNSLSKAAMELQDTARVMSGTAVQTTSEATSVAVAAEQASLNVRTVAAAAEQLNSSITEIGRHVTQSSCITDRAVGDAQRTNVIVQELAEDAKKIDQVLQLISSIAGQTNLLALNATIEAARAGDAGRGFAVVASEVKALAGQTARATGEIGAQISRIQGATEHAVGAIRDITATIREVSTIAATIAAAVEEQSAATREIAHNVYQAAGGTGTVTKSIGSVTEAAGQTGISSAHVLDASEAVSRQTQELRGRVQTFITEVRAA